MRLLLLLIVSIVLVIVRIMMPVVFINGLAYMVILLISPVLVSRFNPFPRGTRKYWYVMIPVVFIVAVSIFVAFQSMGLFTWSSTVSGFIS